MLPNVGIAVRPRQQTAVARGEQRRRQMYGVAVAAYAHYLVHAQIPQLL